MTRYGAVILLAEVMKDKYVKLHQQVPNVVLNDIKKANINNYSIFLKDNLMFSYFEYNGNDFERDMCNLSLSEETQNWWKKTAPCQQPFESNEKGEWWAQMEQVFLFHEEQINKETL